MSGDVAAPRTVARRRCAQRLSAQSGGMFRLRRKRARTNDINSLANRKLSTKASANSTATTADFAAVRGRPDAVGARAFEAGARRCEAGRRVGLACCSASVNSSEPSSSHRFGDACLQLRAHSSGIGLMLGSAGLLRGANVECAPHSGRRASCIAPALGHPKRDWQRLRRRPFRRALLVIMLDGRAYAFGGKREHLTGLGGPQAAGRERRRSARGAARCLPVP